MVPDEERPAPARRSPDKLRYWTPDQAARFVLAVAADRLVALYVVTLNLGLRRSEAGGLRWGDTDLEVGTLMVRRGRTKAGKFIYEGAPKTSSSARTIELDRALVDVLKAHRASQAADRLRWGPAWQGEEDGHVFAKENGAPYNPDAITRRIRRIVARSDLPWVGFHGLRHSSATLLLAGGEQLKVVSERLGHSSTAITADLYQHVTPGLQRGASEKASELLGLG